MGYRIGLDIGITSVGWSVIEDDSNGKPIRIIDLGSRIFDAAEHPKDGSSLSLPRREARGLRRRIRRKKHRVERVKRLLEKYNIISEKEIINMYENYTFPFNVYELRVLGIDNKLTNKELARILINFVKKRGYKSNSKSEESSVKDNGKLLTATKENEILMKEKGYRTIAEMYIKDDKFKLKDKNGDYILDKNGKKQLKIKNSINDYKNTPLRELLIKEIKLILDKQKELNELITDEFINEYLNIFESQRSFDDGPGGDSPYRGNQIEKMLGNCTFEKNEKRAPKATYTFEYFKLLQTLNHIKIEKRILENENRFIEKRFLTKEEKEIIKNLVNSKTSVSYDDLRKILGLSCYERFNLVNYKSTIDFSDEANRLVEKERKLKEFESYNKIKTALNRVEKNYISRLENDELDAIGYALTVYKNDTKRLEYLKSNTKNISEDAMNELLKLSFTKVGSLSLSAMKKIIPKLEDGITYDKAVDLIYEDFRGKVNTEKKTKLRLKDLEEEISNPVVRRGISQSIKVLNAITLKYNQKYGKPDVVVIELARELGKNKGDRNNIEKEQNENMKINENIIKDIKALGKENPTGQDIVKYKLWQEQQNICVYSGKNISINDLFTEAVDIDHIIPYSICFDDSYSNKVLVLASENRQKGNRVPYRYEKEIGRNLDEYEIRINNLIKNPKKKQKLLRENFSREDSKEWKQRNLQDTQYISKLIYNLVKNYMEFSDNNNFERKVWTVNGRITAHIRKRLGIDKIREDGDIHHAIDATVVAITTQGMINKITKYYQHNDGKFMNNSGEYVDFETGEIIDAKKYEEENGIYFPEPWNKFRKELDIRVNCNSKKRMIECLEAEKIYTYQDYEDLEPIFVSRMPRRKNTGTAHMETIRGIRKEKNQIKTVTKTDLINIKLKDGEIDGYPEENKKDDKLLYEALKNQLIKFNGDAKEAFKEDFYKPRSDGSRGPLVKKVKIEANATLGVELNGGKAFAGNGDSIRIDVFYVEGEGYYFVPIYVSDVVKDKLPNKACVSNKNYSEWKEMDDKNFIFSLYPKDLIYIKGKNKIKLNPNNKKEKSIEVDEILAYYVKAGISVASITIQTHDNKYIQANLGIKSLQKLEKYEVDILGNYHKVKLPEKRLPFNIKK